MFYPKVSPWGPVSHFIVLTPGLYYVTTSLQNGYLLLRELAEKEAIFDEILSTHIFEEDIYAFPAASDSMQLVLSSRIFAWDIYRNFCNLSNVRLTFFDFFVFARETVFNMFPLLKPLLSVSAGNIDTWVKKIHSDIKYLWRDPLHPFSKESIPLYIPKGWSDGAIRGDFQPSIISNDQLFRIYYAFSGVPYYLTHSCGTMDMSISDYNIFHLIEKAEEQKKFVPKE